MIVSEANFSWHVAVTTQNGHERLARVELDAHGFEVHVPTEYASLKLANRKHVTADKLLLSPYFFVRFHTADDEEHSLVLAQRGVKHVLTNANGKPSAIPDQIITAHRRREYLEQHNVTKRREKSDDGLALGQQYRILRGNGAGVVATLIAVDRGLALLGHESVMLRVATCDLEAASKRQKAA